MALKEFSISLFEKTYCLKCENRCGGTKKEILRCKHQKIMELIDGVLDGEPILGDTGVLFRKI